MGKNVFREGLKRYLSEAELQTLSAVRIAVAGAGGLGSNAAHMLVRSGFTQLVIVDFDVVSDSNLNRQFFFPDQIGQRKVEALRENLLRINPDVQIQTVFARVTQENAADLLGDCDIWIEAFDGAADKQMLAVAGASRKKYVICASGIAGYGNTDRMTTRRMGEYLYLVGDFESGIDSYAPFCPRVMLAAAKQADLALELALSNPNIAAKVRKGEAT